MKKIVVIILLAGTLWGCNNDVLNLTDPNRITTQTFWQSENDVISAFAATYSVLLGRYIYGDISVLIYNGRGDDFFIRNDMQTVHQPSTFTNTPDNADIRNMFSAYYQMIFRANQLIENIPGVPGLSDSQKTAYIAEAKFLRGLAYYTLVTVFGEVPLITSTPISKDDYFVAKSPINEIWTQAKSDFKDASEGLGMSYSAPYLGRATNGAALAFLGQSCLYTEDWDGVISSLTPLTSAPYSYKLMDNFEDNFVQEIENNSESIFEIQFADIPGLGVATHYTARMFAPAEVQGWFEAFPTNKLFEAFEKEKTVEGKIDARMYATLVWDYEGATFYNLPFSSFKSPFPQFKAMFRKYQNYNLNNEATGSTGGISNSDNNERVMRYDHVLMMLAEAHTMKNQLNEANVYLKQIRKRANLDENKTSGYNQTQMIEEIRHQRMLEFAREGQRFYDLKRWGILKQEILNSDKEGKEFYVEGKHDYFPIPQGEIDSNPAIEQNSHWK
ncbi:MAG: RagB/SusD family nutrient uptake outer membrane protein [Bacteroidales bacterium]|jgi:hypothetical protein|nr:RagB/SusD family nutrient uptake outer membrane protein [Bacteroidales bacterium]